MKTMAVCARRGVVTIREWWARADLQGSLIALLILFFEDTIKKPVALRSSTLGH
jgi:hypothetical protein